MRQRSALLIAPLFLLLPASCADERRIQEIACQQRLVDVTGDTRVIGSAGRNIIGPTFARISKRFEEVALDGCSESQAYSAKALARVTRELADSAGAAESALEKGGPGLKEQQAFMMFADRLERFEMRRKVLREELALMTAEQK